VSVGANHGGRARGGVQPRTAPEGLLTGPLVASPAYYSPAARRLTTTKCPCKVLVVLVERVTCPFSQKE